MSFGFDTLRAREQLGYAVQADLRLYPLTLLTVAVSSASHAPAYVNDRIEAILVGAHLYVYAI